MQMASSKGIDEQTAVRLNDLIILRGKKEKEQTLKGSKPPFLIRSEEWNSCYHWKGKSCISKLPKKER